MEARPEQLLVQQKQVWDKLAQGREKWHDFMMAFLKPISDEMIRALELKINDTVLDLATGTGEPGLTIAGVVTNGEVFGGDLSSDMLRIAQAKALLKGISNYKTVVCEAGNLPFADNTFDAISCRNGYMFFPDLLRATQELYRIIKPGRRIVVSVWGASDKNAWVTIPMRVINSNINTPASSLVDISLFRCAKTHLMTNIFRETGLKNVNETYLTGMVSYPSKEVYWEFITEVTAPVAMAISQLDAATQHKIKHELFGFIQEMSLTENTVFDYEALVISGEK